MMDALLDFLRRDVARLSVDLSGRQVVGLFKR
jgi:hypothetical protein